MKEYYITIEVDDNVTIEELKSAIQDVADKLNTTECFYSIEETKTLWYVEFKNDRYCERELEVYSHEKDAMKSFIEYIESYKDEDNFEYEEGDTDATWTDHGNFCHVSIWKEEVR